MKRGKWDKHIWEEQDIKFLKDNYQSMTNRELADGLGIKLTTCRTKLYQLGLKRMEMEYWTEEQIQFLKDNYLEMGDTEMAEIFNETCPKEKGWRKKHIEKKRRYMKLKRSKAVQKRIHARNVELGYFKICPIKAWETRGGATPAGVIKIWNRPDGGEFAVVKIEDGFVHYNRWLYEDNFGRLTSEDLVVTKSGDIVARGPEDLMVIDRAENARRNSLKRYPEELRETVQLLRSINSNINQ